jgi:hypothetical protein
VGSASPPKAVPHPALSLIVTEIPIARFKNWVVVNHNLYQVGSASPPKMVSHIARF